MRPSLLNAAAHIHEKHIRERQAARGRAPTSVSSGISGDFCAEFNNIAFFDGNLHQNTCTTT
jgi:hypothetical protein